MTGPAGPPTERGTRLSERHLAYFRFIDACAQPGCPLCHLADEASRRYLDALIYEQVNDPDTRRQIRAAWGFCNWHTWMLDEVKGSAFGGAIVYEDVLGRAIHRLDRLRDRPAGAAGWLGWIAGRRGPGRRIRRWLGGAGWPAVVALHGRRGRCPACADAARAETRAIETLLEFLGDLQFRRAYERSEGLCVPHTLMVVERGAWRPAVGELLTLTLAKWTALRRTLERFIDKHDYRNRAPFTEEESVAAKRAFGTVAGTRGLFGNDLHGAPPDTPPPTEPEGPDAGTPRPEGAEPEAFERARLELRIRELTEQLNEASTRAAALHWRLSRVAEDRNVLELNLSGERGAAQLAERALADLRQEHERLRAAYERLRAEHEGLRAEHERLRAERPAP